MKKHLVASIVALALVAGSQQTASAWSHFKFGIGMNVDWSAGNNCFLWGLFRNGPIEGHGGPLLEHYLPAPVGIPYGQHGYHAPAPLPAGQPGFQGAAPTPVQKTPGQSQLASYTYPSAYPASYFQQPSYYYPMSYYQPSNYYYPMNYSNGYPNGYSFYGN